MSAFLSRVLDEIVHWGKFFPFPRRACSVNGRRTPDLLHSAFPRTPPRRTSTHSTVPTAARTPTSSPAGSTARANTGRGARGSASRSGCEQNGAEDDQYRIRCRATRSGGGYLSPQRRERVFVSGHRDGLLGRIPGGLARGRGGHRILLARRAVGRAVSCAV